MPIHVADMPHPTRAPPPPPTTNQPSTRPHLQTAIAAPHRLGRLFPSPSPPLPSHLMRRAPSSRTQSQPKPQRSRSALASLVSTSESGLHDLCPRPRVCQPCGPHPG
ncbi:hypothetical protein K505DRAFT_328700 [Melanomma pulvis-pyrius CBS 109.77]|uniref:Uncharacterized protein n=1 Tax=Melanomma pulvis-pyrius CBS 109.77 TaxID=1314802 RepID=A0A6A6WXS5_9PLEO|nr:hypothetical protein K505DRAFT_328700 [Melanomma pulvis-pyrius CBS 109.77]